MARFFCVRSCFVVAAAAAMAAVGLPHPAFGQALIIVPPLSIVPDHPESYVFEGGSGSVLFTVKNNTKATIEIARITPMIGTSSDGDDVVLSTNIPAASYNQIGLAYQGLAPGADFHFMQDFVSGDTSGVNDHDFGQTVLSNQIAYKSPFNNVIIENGPIGSAKIDVLDPGVDPIPYVPRADPPAPAPEPSSVATVGIVFLFAGGLMLKARCRSSHAAQ